MKTLLVTIIVVMLFISSVAGGMRLPAEGAGDEFATTYWRIYRDYLRWKIDQNMSN
jgi:hypothetical protein